VNDGKRFTTDIHTGARRRQNLGNLNDLAASITDTGLRNPIVITPGNQLISGYRRLQATTLLGLPDIPVHVVGDLAAAVDLITVENGDRTCQAPMAAAELVDYVGTIRALRRTPRMQTVREAGNAILGFSWSRYCLIQLIVDAARNEPDPDGPAHQGLADADAILAGQHPRDRDGRPASLKTIAAALADAQPLRPTPITPVGRRQPVRNQPKALASAIAGLNGLIAGLSQVDTIDTTISPTDADRWIGDINRAQRALRSLNAKLKEHADATR
jgi:ParB-like nuclease domain